LFQCYKSNLYEIYDHQQVQGDGVGAVGAAQGHVLWHWQGPSQAGGQVQVHGQTVVVVVVIGFVVVKQGQTVVVVINLVVVIVVVLGVVVVVVHGIGAVAPGPLVEQGLQ
jgi:uncharacterized protein (UPF0548 family)